MSESTLKDFLYTSEMIFNKDQEEYNINILNTFFTIVKEDKFKTDKKSELLNYLDNKINSLQDQLTFYLTNILQDKNFKKLEGSWLSIYDLIKNSQLSSSLKLLLMDVKPEELINDISDAPDFDQSYLFKRVYEDNYGTPGGEPMAAVVFDHYFTKNFQDVKLMGDLANIFAAAHVQVLSSVDPSVFDIKNFNQLNQIIDLKTLFESPQFLNWNGFRTKEEARYMTLLLPRVLKRIPYDPIKNPIKYFNFLENIDYENQDNFCWGNAAFAMANCITRSFANYQWLAAIRGVENGGKVDSMAIYTYRSTTGEDLILCPTEIAITDRREKELNDLGFLSLCYFKQSDYSVFFSGQTMEKPLIYDNDDATGSSALSSSLPYMLNVSRFAHYMKCMIRDCIGSNMTKNDIQQFLQNWISGYVTLNDSNDENIKIKYPLRGANVEIQEKLDQPGHYFAIVRIIPHFQLESINMSMRMVVNLPNKS
jgi:type VI secretion system protein ImpC